MCALQSFWFCVYVCVCVRGKGCGCTGVRAVSRVWVCACMACPLLTLRAVQALSCVSSLLWHRNGCWRSSLTSVNFEAKPVFCLALATVVSHCTWWHSVCWRANAAAPDGGWLPLCQMTCTMAMRVCVCCAIKSSQVRSQQRCLACVLATV